MRLSNGCNKNRTGIVWKSFFELFISFAVFNITQNEMKFRLWSLVTLPARCSFETEFNPQPSHLFNAYRMCLHNRRVRTHVNEWDNYTWHQHTYGVPWYGLSYTNSVCYKRLDSIYAVLLTQLCHVSELWRRTYGTPTEVSVSNFTLFCNIKGSLLR